MATGSGRPPRTSSPAHGNGFSLTRPPRYVLLLRTDTSDETPPSTVSDGLAAVARLPAEHQLRLQAATYPSARGSVALIEHEAGRARMRFNADQMQQWGLSVQSDDVREAVRRLETEMQAGVTEFALRRSDCLVLHNWRVVHGRGALRAGSERRLLRMWIAGPCGSGEPR